MRKALLARGDAHIARKATHTAGRGGAAVGSEALARYASDFSAHDDMKWG